MKINKGVLVTLGVVFLLSSIPYTVAQNTTGLILQFYGDSNDFGYITRTIAIRVDGSLISNGIRDNPVFNLANRTGPKYLGVPDNDNLYWYDFAWSAFFEANDTNKDGTFTPGVDQHVGAIVPLSQRWDSWNYSDFLFEKGYEVGYLQVSPDSDFLDEDLGVMTGLHVNYTANMTITHQHDFLVRNVVGWSGVPGHMRPMDIEIGIDVHFNFTDHFKVDLRVSGWDWTYDDSILVFILSPQVRVHQSLDPELESVSNFTSVKHVGNRFFFGQGFIEYAQNASAGSVPHQVQVNASHDVIDTGDWISHYEQEIPAIFTAFENFSNETLDFDLDIGIVSDQLFMIPTTPPISNPPAPDISYNELLLTAGIISIVTMVIIIYRDGKKKFNDKSLKPSA
ncbi:MAG: hypothetical protein ACW98U_04415 [Candidatus Thorarchaeota archaeon]|jgi:hypothetical protein